MNTVFYRTWYLLWDGKRKITVISPMLRIHISEFRKVEEAEILMTKYQRKGRNSESKFSKHV